MFSWYKAICVRFVGVFFISAMSLSAQGFDPGLLDSNAEKILDEYVLTQPETDTKRFKDMKTLIIPQFIVNFETTQKGELKEKGLFMESRIGLAGLDEAAYQQLTDKILEIFVTAYRNAGYQVVAPAEMVAHANWSKRIKEFEPMPKTASDNKTGITMVTYVPSAFKNQHPLKFAPHELLSDYQDAVQASGAVTFQFLRFDADMSGSKGTLATEQFVQAGAAFAYAVVQKYRFGMYSGTFKKPLIYKEAIGAIAEVDRQEIEGAKQNTVKVTYQLNVDSAKFEAAVMKAAELAAKMSVKNLQRKTG